MSTKTAKEEEITIVCKVRKISNSYYLLLPKETVEYLDLKPGQLVKVTIKPTWAKEANKE